MDGAKSETEELRDIFPALAKYKGEHTKANLKKLCVEIAEFCGAVYASTQNDQERDIYNRMVDRIKK